MPSIDERDNHVGEGRRVLERRGLGGWSVYHRNASYVVVGAQKRGFYYVVPNLHADNPREFSRMLAYHTEGERSCFRGLELARREADNARALILNHHFGQFAKMLRKQARAR